MMIHTRFNPSGLNTHFPKQCTQFDEYLSHMRKIIQETRYDLSPQHAEQIIDINAPRLSQSSYSDKVVILIHGLLNSAGIMADLHQGLHRAGLTACSLLLPGHGTRPGDLLHVRMEDWLQTVQFAINAFKGKQITLIGYSLGATLSIAVAQMAYPIDKLVLIAPAIGLPHPSTAFLPLYRQLSMLSERYVWHRRAADNDYAKYQSTPLNAIYQSYRTIKAINNNNKLRRLPQAIQLIISRDDETVCHQQAIKFVKQQPNLTNKITVYANKSSKFKADNQLEVKPSLYSDFNITDFAHTSLTNSPSNPHYGAEGDFNDFLHYHLHPSTQNRNKPHRLGAITPSNLSQYHMQRLHFNPDFDNMLRSILYFIQA